jgi:LPS export ABC transporter protein LptC
MINLISDNKNKFAAFFIGCFFMLACENDVNVVKELGKKKPGIEEGKNITSYLSMGGKMKAKLTAPLLLRYQGDSALKSEFPKTLFVEFFNDSAKVGTKLKAKYGRYVENENKIYLRDSVVIIRVNGDTLFTSELYWDQTLGRIYTDKFVEIFQKEPRQKLFAKNGFTANQDFTEYTFFLLQPGSFFFLPDSTAAPIKN